MLKKEDFTFVKVGYCMQPVIFIALDGGIEPSKKIVLTGTPNRPPSPSSQTNLGNIKLLQQGLAQEKLTLAQAKTVIDYVALEVLFSLFDSVNFTAETLLRVSQAEELTASDEVTLGLSYAEFEPVLTKVSQLHFQWETAGLNSFNPTLAPVLKQSVDSKTLSGWDKYLNGKFTLWDIALRLGKSITAVTRALLPFIKKRVSAIADGA
jgi:chemotaxis family two-component system response regulator PixG